MNYLSSLIFDYDNHGGSMGGMDHSDGGWGSMWWMWIIPVLIVLAISIAVYLSSNRSSGAMSNPVQDHAKDAKAIVAERYAKDEITTEEYNDKIKTLNGEK
ncbi:MAG TPA: hypothetical protein PKB15_04185 [Acidimicrobiia bacterium]|nr:hypothetical protein [Acidimicrobiia bacterium]